jgi:hypothetical protein
MGNNDSLVPGLSPWNTLHRRLLPPQLSRAGFAEEAGASWLCVSGLESWNEEGCDE